jgi:hypothetical protein
VASVHCRVVSNKLPTVGRNFPIATAKRIRRGAELIKVGAQRRSRVDTGAMRAGWHVEPAGDGFIVANDVDYAIYNEFGTVHITAQPMLHPAADEVMGKMGDLFAGLEGELA